MSTEFWGIHTRAPSNRGLMWYTWLVSLEQQVLDVEPNVECFETDNFINEYWHHFIEDECLYRGSSRDFEDYREHISRALDVARNFTGFPFADWKKDVLEWVDSQDKHWISQLHVHFIYVDRPKLGEENRLVPSIRYPQFRPVYLDTESRLYRLAA